MIYRIFFLLLLSTVSSLAGAQKALKSPRIDSCTSLTQCEPGLGKLDETEKQVIQNLLSVITAGATEGQVAKRFTREPFDKNPPMQAWGQPVGTTTYKALWSTAEPPARLSGPHFDVLFINDRAVMFTWYAAGLKKIVRVQIAE